MADNQEVVAAIDQGDQSFNAPIPDNESYQLNFLVTIEKGALTPSSIRPPGSFYFEWTISTDPADIDGPEGDNLPNMEEKQDSDSSDEESKENEPDPIRNIEESGWTLDGSENYSFPLVIPPDLQLKGYEYTEFKPTTNQGLLDIHIAPTQSEAMAALQDLRKIRCCCRRILYNQPDFTDAE